jgi:hypothetical protein
MGEVRRRSFKFCTACEKPPEARVSRGGARAGRWHPADWWIRYYRCEGEGDLGGRSTSSVDAEEAVCPGVNTKGHGWSDE